MSMWQWAHKKGNWFVTNFTIMHLLIIVHSFHMKSRYKNVLAWLKVLSVLEYSMWKNNELLKAEFQFIKEVFDASSDARRSSFCFKSHILYLLGFVHKNGVFSHLFQRVGFMNRIVYTVRNKLNCVVVALAMFILHTS